MSSPDKHRAPANPIVDEWGIYDPARAGIAAVLDRLDSRVPTTVFRNDPRTMVSSVRDVTEFRSAKD